MRAAVLGLAVRVFFLASAAEALATSSGPYPNRRVPDPTGTWYVVVNIPHWTAETAEFKFCRRADGSPPVTPYRVSGMGGYPASGGVYRFERVEPIPGDAVLASGTLATLPEHLVVSAAGKGFLALDNYEGSGRGDVLVILSGDGTVLQKKKLRDLLTAEEMLGFPNSTAGLLWYAGAWIDDEAREAFVVAGGPLARAVHFDTGKVRPAGPADVRRALSLPYPDAVRLGLELVATLRVGGVEAKVGELAAGKDLDVRVRAVVAAAALGRPGAREALRALLSGPDRLLREGMRRALQYQAPGHDEAVLEFRALAYVVRMLPDVLGAEAIPLLAEAPSEVGHSVVEAFRKLGPKAVPDLLPLLKSETPNTRWVAARALGEIGEREALPGLLAAMDDADRPAAHEAAMSAIKIGKESIAGDMLEKLVNGCASAGEIFYYFGQYQHPPAVPVLIENLERLHGTVSDRASIRRALAFQTGVDLGDDPAAWRDWLARGKK